MNVLLEQIANGLAIGCTYALIALGYNLAFGVLKIVNLAYGEVFMAASYVPVVLVGVGLSNALLLWLGGVVAATLVGTMIHCLAVRPLGNVSDLDSPRHLQVLVSTVGCSLVLQNVALLSFGGNPRRFPRLIGDGEVNLGVLQIRSSVALTAIVAIGVMCGLALLIQRSDLGLRLRAIAEDRTLARLSGIRTTRDELICVALSSVIAGAAAMLISEVIGTVSPFIGATYGMKGLIVLIVGRAGNMAGAVSVGLSLGLMEVLASAYLSSTYRDGIAYAALLLVVVAVGSRTIAREGRVR